MKKTHDRRYPTGARCRGDAVSDDGCYRQWESGSCWVDSARRRWREAEKRRIVAESYCSGESASAVARHHGVHTSALFRWRRRYRNAPDTGAGFVSVDVEPSEVTSGAANGRMEIVRGEELWVVICAIVRFVARAFRRHIDGDHAHVRIGHPVRA